MIHRIPTPSDSQIFRLSQGLPVSIKPPAPRCYDCGRFHNWNGSFCWNCTKKHFETGTPTWKLPQEEEAI